jgi:NMD protein affecting ribosome stability and mRNA decay
MKKFFPKNFPWHFPKSKKESQEFGKGKKDILICRKCNAVYWYKSWHHSLDDYPELKEEKGIKFVFCPACRMIKEGKYEGELILENVPGEKKEEIENLINNFGELAYQNDPMDRIISIEEIAKGMIRVLSTENQMIKRLAKKLKRTYKGKINIVHSKKESVVRVRVVFPGK